MAKHGCAFFHFRCAVIVRFRSIRHSARMPLYLACYQVRAQASEQYRSLALNVLPLFLARDQHSSLAPLQTRHAQNDCAGTSESLWPEGDVSTNVGPELLPNHERRNYFNSLRASANARRNISCTTGTVSGSPFCQSSRNHVPLRQHFLQESLPILASLFIARARSKN